VSDDNVERLRAWADWNDGKSPVSPIEDPFRDSLSRTMRYAADEIEHLRALITEWADATDTYWDSGDGMRRFQADLALRKAVGR